jgi:hypothetical protein
VSDLKLAVIIPVGYVDRHGYQRNLYECVASAASFADHVYLAESLRDAPGLAALAAYKSNISIVESDAARFARDSENNDIYDYARVVDLLNVALDTARSDGYNVAIQMACNWYITTKTQRLLRLEVRDLLDRGEPWAWLYWRYQLAGQMFHCGDRAPWVVNLQQGWRFALQDKLVSLDGTQFAPEYERGEWRERDGHAIIDTPLELTRDELRDKFNRIKCYQGLVPKRNPVFDWDYWGPYYVRRFGAKQRDDRAPVEAGRIIAQRSQADFVSQIVLRGMGLWGRVGENESL